MIQVPTPQKQPTSEMLRALESIQLHGGTAMPRGGGQWYGNDKRRLFYSSNIADQPIQTAMIIKLSAAGLLDRVHRHVKPNQDSYRLTPAGRAALRAKPTEGTP